MNLKKFITQKVVVIFTLIVAILIIIFFILTWRIDNIKGYFSPAFSNDGKEMLFIERETLGFRKTVSCDLFGGCFEKAYILKDKFYLRRMDLQTKKIITIEEFPQSPLIFKIAERHSGSVYGILTSSILFDKQNNFQYSLKLQSSSSENLCISKIFNNVENKFIEKKTWREDINCAYLGKQSSLYNEFEIIELKGREMFPSAIAKIDHKNKSSEILIKSANNFNYYHPSGVNYNDIIPLSNKNTLEREKEINETYNKQLQKYKAEGLTEVDALLKTNDEMEKLGYYPASPTITVSILAEAELSRLYATDQLVPFFEISEAEMRTGIFSDMEIAIKNPGVPAKKSHGKYITHRDFDNSKKINEFIDSGGKIFYTKINDIYYKIIFSD